MNIEAYDSESLRKIVRELQNENRQLKEKLMKANIPFDTENPFEETIHNMEEYDPDQGGRIMDAGFISDEKAKKFLPCFGDARMCMQND